jgi:hypothetical protein
MIKYLITLEKEKVLIELPNENYVNICFPNAKNYVEVQDNG